MEELKKEVISVDLLDKLIFPSTKKDWKDYSEAGEFFLGIKNPGISSKVRYNEQHTMAYVRIHPNVEDAFVTYVYIVSAPDTTTPDTNVNNGFTLTAEGDTVTITAPADTTVTSYAVKALRFNSDLKEYVQAANQTVTQNGNDGTYTVEMTGLYNLTFTAVVNGKTVSVGSYTGELVAAN